MVCPRFRQNSLFLTCEKVKIILFPICLKSSHISDRLKNHLSQLIFQMRLLSLQVWMLSEQLSLLDLNADWTSLCLGCSHRVFWSWHKFCCCVCVFIHHPTFLFHVFVPLGHSSFQLLSGDCGYNSASKQLGVLHPVNQPVTTQEWLLFLICFCCFFSFFFVYIYFLIKLLLIHFLLSELEAFCDYCGWWVVN